MPIENDSEGFQAEINEDQDLVESPQRKQLNIWLSPMDIAFLRELAAEREQSVSALIRRAIAVWRRQRQPTREQR